MGVILLIKSSWRHLTAIFETFHKYCGRFLSPMVVSWVTAGYLLFLTVTDASWDVSRLISRKAKSSWTFQRHLTKRKQFSKSGLDFLCNVDRNKHNSSLTSITCTGYWLLLAKYKALEIWLIHPAQNGKTQDFPSNVFPDYVNCYLILS